MMASASSVVHFPNPLAGKKVNSPKYIILFVLYKSTRMKG